MNVINTLKARLNEKETTIRGVYAFAILLFLTIVQNPDWDSSLLWWGSIGLLIVSFICVNGEKIYIDKTYSIWISSFVALCGLSILWAVNTNPVIGVMKNLIVNLVVLLILRASLKNVRDINRLLKIFLITVVINSIYLLITQQDIFLSLGADSEYFDRLGTADGWNANAIGLITSTGMIACVYLLSISKKKYEKVFYSLVIALTIVITFLTGSRTALLKIVIGVAAFVLLYFKGRRIRTLLIIAAIVGGVYLIVMNVPFLYSMIGERLEGLISLITGVGEADSSANLRGQLIADAIERWHEKPILGYGIDCYKEISTVKNFYAHNNFAELLADLGVIGFITYYLGYFITGRKLFKRSNKSMSQGMRNLKYMLIAMFVMLLISDYGTISYASIVTSIMIMIMFAFIVICNKGKEGEEKSQEKYVEVKESAE